MAEVLVAGGWIKIEESVDDVCKAIDILAVEPVLFPLSKRITLTRSPRTESRSPVMATAAFPKERMEVAAVAIQGVRERISD